MLINPRAYIDAILPIQQKFEILVQSLPVRSHFFLDKYSINSPEKIMMIFVIYKFLFILN